MNQENTRGMKTRFLFFVLWLLASITRYLLRLAKPFRKTLSGNGGTSLPGLLALRFMPHVLGAIVPPEDYPCVGVTGTNGKTTTSGFLAQGLNTILAGQVIQNTLGANMKTGITSLLLASSDPFGKLEGKGCVLELDEASVHGVVQAFPLDGLVVTNLYRDQLDRYGELDTTAAYIAKGFPHVKDVLYLNADDPLVYALHRHASPHHRIVTFSVMLSSESEDPTLMDEGLHPIPFPIEGTECPVCGHPLHFTRRVYAQLGGYDCPQCGFAHPVSPELQVTLVASSPEMGTEIAFTWQGIEATYHYTLPVPGSFNVYNWAAASCVCLDVLTQRLGDPTQALQAFIPESLLPKMQVFGRAETLQYQGKTLKVFLIKNPVGTSEVLRWVAMQPNIQILLALNDQAADGKDVSWIWDAPFERLTHPQSKVKALPSVWVSGKRAEDMALRLHYAGYATEQLVCIPSLEQALQEACRSLNPKETLVVIPTYTALLSLQSLLKS